MLMAKLKVRATFQIVNFSNPSQANDWGALDSNLAIQRAEQLSSLLVSALCFGTTDPHTQEPLKNFDSDEVLSSDDGMATFYLELPDNPILSGLSLHDCLRTLRMGYQGRDARYRIGEADFFKALSSHLAGLVEARLKHVSQWLTANTERFGEKGEITVLIRTFDSYSKELRASESIIARLLTDAFTPVNSLINMKLKFPSVISRLYRCHSL
ncbi:2165_t:CDS:2 [Acaulospora colombiana]|uniref:2165_t:CDS:1 n=1 Tax=Acaulospora colombiana TaxID=27376 RepID=A0ACA9M161_9GLOM|nr:2165_t:CDS:2 [Acaulospora colombiana]